jgi:hypothetical protein
MPGTSTCQALRQGGLSVPKDLPEISSDGAPVRRLRARLLAAAHTHVRRPRHEHAR